MTESLNNPQNTFLNSAHLKIIAIVSMLIDHVGAFILLPWLNQTFGIENRAMWVDIYQLTRNIGRLAFPIFCFLIVEGFVHTRSVKNYMIRLGLFALISEIPFDLAKSQMLFDMSSQNVFFTLLAGLISLWALTHIDQPLGRLAVVGLSMAGVTILNTDYSYLGVAVIIILYILRDTRFYQSLLGAFSFIGSWYAMPAFIITYFYNGERGRFNSKLFYWFYPVHLLLYAGIAYLLTNG